MVQRASRKESEHLSLSIAALFSLSLSSPISPLLNVPLLLIFLSFSPSLSPSLPDSDPDSLTHTRCLLPHVSLSLSRTRTSFASSFAYLGALCNDYLVREEREKMMIPSAFTSRLSCLAHTYTQSTVAGRWAHHAPNDLSAPSACRSDACLTLSSQLQVALLYL